MHRSLAARLQPSPPEGCARRWPGLNLGSRDQHPPGAIRIVDLYHARQHVWELPPSSPPTTSGAQTVGGDLPRSTQCGQDRIAGDDPVRPARRQRETRPGWRRKPACWRSSAASEGGEIKPAARGILRVDTLSLIGSGAIPTGLRRNFGEVSNFARSDLFGSGYAGFNLLLSRSAHCGFGIRLKAAATSRLPPPTAAA